MSKSKFKEMKKYFTLLLLPILIVQLSIAQTTNLEWAGANGRGGILTPYESALDNFGNIINVGSFVISPDFDPSIDTLELTSAGQSDGYIQKLDSNGDLLWCRQIGGIYTEAVRAVTTDLFGNIYAVGQFYDSTGISTPSGSETALSNGEDDIFVLKLTPAGNLSYLKTFGGTGFDYAYDISIGAAGNLYIVGEFEQSFDADPNIGTTTVTTNGQIDGYILKLSPSGTLDYAKNIGGSSFDMLYGIDHDSDGNFYTYGKFKSTIDADPGAGVSNITATSTSYDVMVSKFTPSGNFVWAQSFGNASNEFMRSIHVDAEDNLLLSGNFTGTVDFDPGSGVSNINGLGTIDMFISKLDSAGNFQWAGTLPDVFYRTKTYVDTDSDCNIRMNVDFSTTTDLDPTSNVQIETPVSGTDLAIIDLDKNGSLLDINLIAASSNEKGGSVLFEDDNTFFLTGLALYTTDINPFGPMGSHGIFANFEFTAKYSVCAATYDTLTEASCQSLTSPSGNYIYSSTGIYFDTLVNSNGCDSIVTIDFTFLTSTTDTNIVESCGEYINAGGTVYTSSGFYNDTLFFTNGCDSLIKTIDLTIIPEPVAVVTQLDQLTLEADSIEPTTSFQWIDCSDYSIITGEVNSIFSATQNGSYAVIITNIEGCSDTSACTTISSVNITEFEKNEMFNVFPNPSNGTFNIQFAEGNGNVELMIYGLDGKLIYSEKAANNNLIVNLNIPSGVYSIVATSEEGSILTKKLIIK